MKERTKEIPGEVSGIPAVFTHVLRGPGKSRDGRAAQVSIKAQRGVHEVRAVLVAMEAARTVAEQVEVEWADEVCDRSYVGVGFRHGQIDGLQWNCDWSVGCHVSIVGTLGWSRNFQSMALATVREWFVRRLKREPDEVVIVFPEVG